MKRKDADSIENVLDDIEAHIDKEKIPPQDRPYLEKARDQVKTLRENQRMSKILVSNWF